MQQPPTVDCQHCTVPTRNPDHNLPNGAVRATEFDDDDTRVIYSADVCDAERLSVHASALQTVRGNLVDDPAEERPGVVAVLPEAVSHLSIGEAFDLAAALWRAAKQAEDWAHEAAQQLPPSAVARQLPKVAR